MDIEPITPPQPPAKPSGSSAQRPTPVQLPIPAPKVVNRVFYPDLTGLYEHVPAKGKNSAILLQLNQAGGALVGWFTGPPTFVSNLSPTVSRAKGWNETRMKPGVLLAILTDMSTQTQSVQFSWRETPSAAQPDPANLMAMHMLDPQDITGSEKVGRLRILDGPFREIGREVALAFEFDPSFNSSDLSKYDTFRRVSMATRIPNFVIQGLPREMQVKLIAEQVCPIPTSFLDEKRSRVTETDGQPPAVAKLIAEWWKAPDKDTRRIKREQIANYVLGELDPRGVGEYYREVAYAPARAQAEWKSLTIDGHTRSYLGWYRQIASEELDLLRSLQAASPKTAPKTEDNLLLHTFRQVGFEPQGDYLYTFSFKSEGKSPLPKPSAGADNNPLKPVTLKGGVFKLDIKKELVQVEKESDGSVKMKDDQPVVKSRETKWDTGGGNTALAPTSYLNNGFIGAFGEIGAGIKFEGKSANSPSGGSFKDATFFSSLDLEKEDFAFATFSAVMLGGPSAGLGNYVSLDVFSSRYVEVRLSAANGQFVLSTSETKFIKFKTIELSDLKPKFTTDLKKLAEDYDKKWTRPQAEGRVIDLCTSLAWIVPLFDWKAKTPNVDPKRPAPNLKTALKSEKAVIEAFYKVGSADLDATDAAIPGPEAYSPRLNLEVVLATYRAWFTNPDALMEVVGMTSPEQPARANLVLSQERAAAVVQAVKDALGSSMRIEKISAKGKGEEPALSSGLKDPEASGLTREQFQALFPDEVKKWPLWRRTDLLVDGELIVRVKAAE
jgi:hypothetical protein